MAALSCKLADHVASLRADTSSSPPPAVVIFLAHACIHCRDEVQEAVRAKLAAEVSGVSGGTTQVCYGGARFLLSVH